MWYCPTCGESSEDDFDVCWKCGAARDGTPAADLQADGSDSAPPDPFAGPGLFDASKNGRVVELCSVANPIEANAVCDALESAGIAAEIAGDAWGNTAGGLPLGETVSPRIWVREEDAARARAILARQADQSDEEASLQDDRRGRDMPDAAWDEDNVQKASGAGFRRLGQGLLLAGVVCLAGGSIWALYAWAVMRTYSGTARGEPVSCEEQFSYSTGARPDFPLAPKSTDLSIWCWVKYEFVVNGKLYYAMDRQRERRVTPMPIHYNPMDPTSNIVGPLISPWSILVCTLGTGGALLAIGWGLGRIRDQNRAAKMASH